MTQKLIEAALAYGRAEAEYLKAWKAWANAAPLEYASTDDESPRPIFDRDVRPVMYTAVGAKERLCGTAEELYAGSAGLLALADEATAREPNAPDADEPVTARLV